MAILRIVYDWWRLRDAARKLREMDDRALRDIGLTREEIAYAVQFGRGNAQPVVERRPPGAELVATAAHGYTPTTKQLATEALRILAFGKLLASRVDQGTARMPTRSKS
jgi:hypothetical protein